MPARNVNLTEHFDQFIEDGVASGRFSNASEIVREGLRLLEQREREDQAKIHWLRGAAKEAFGSIRRGEGMAFDSMDELAEHIHALSGEVFAEKVAKRRG